MKNMKYRSNDKIVKINNDQVGEGTNKIIYL